MKFLTLLLALIGQFSVVVRNPDGKMVPYEPGETVQLPTDKYQCRVEADQDPEHNAIQVICTEKGQEVINFAEICYRNKPDKNVGAFKLNVSKTDKPNFIFFMVGCRTVPDGTTQL